MAAVWQGITADQFPHRCPEIYSRLRKIDSEIAGGTAALVALIVNNHLYVANVGMLFCCFWLLRYSVLFYWFGYTRYAVIITLLRNLRNSCAFLGVNYFRNMF